MAETITMTAQGLRAGDSPIIPFIEGDGSGPDLWRAAVRVLDAAVAAAYAGNRRIVWQEVLAGEKSFKLNGSWLPPATVEAFRTHLVGIKGPLTTPVGGGIRSLNVALRQDLDLFVCQRPVRWFQGVPSPVTRPQDVDMVIFRENTEDIYTGLEFENGSAGGTAFKRFLQEAFPQEFKKIRFPESAGFSIKPVSQEGTERLVRAAIGWALANRRHSVTLVHKGNIMKFTEGAFRNWGYALAEREFGDRIFSWRQWEQVKQARGEAAADLELQAAKAAGKLLVKDIIADACFQQCLLDPTDLDVLATTNLNGDYLSDALAAQVGGIGIAPGANINYVTGHAIFEATHGTAPRLAGLDKANPSSVILSGEMMLRHLGWNEAADRIIPAIENERG